MVVTFAGCSKTVYVPQTRTEYVERERVDSVYLRDSIYVTLRTANDTVYITQYCDRIRGRVSIRTDTVCRVDSISYPVEVVRTETKMNGFQKFFFWIGIGFTLALILWVAVKIYIR